MTLPILDATRMSMSAVSFLAQLNSGIFNLQKVKNYWGMIKVWQAPAICGFFLVRFLIRLSFFTLLWLILFSLAWSESQLRKKLQSLQFIVNSFEQVLAGIYILVIRISSNQCSCFWKHDDFVSTNDYEAIVLMCWLSYLK